MMLPAFLAAVMHDVFISKKEEASVGLGKTSGGRWGRAADRTDKLIFCNSYEDCKETWDNFSLLLTVYLFDN